MATGQRSSGNDMPDKVMKHSFNRIISCAYFLGRVNLFFSHNMCRNIYTCLSTGGGGVPGQVPPPGRYTHPGQLHPQAGTPPGQVHPPWAGTPPRQVNPPGQVHPLPPTPRHSACWDKINKRAVRIPLECILVCTIM